jgi:hypothetical protein
MSRKPHIVGEIRKLKKEFDGWLPDITLSERNKTMFTREQLNVVEAARSKGVTPKDISATIGISVFRVHQIVNHTRLLQRQEATMLKKSHLGILGTENDVQY